MARKKSGGTVLDQLEAEETAAEVTRKAMYEPAPENPETPVIPAEEPHEEIENTPVEEVVADPNAAVAEEVIEEEVTEETWAQKFKTLQGKYDAEMPRITRETKEAKEALEGLRRTTATLRADLGQTQQYARTLETKVADLEKAAKAIPAKKDETLDETVDADLAAVMSDNPSAGNLIKKLMAGRKDDQEKITALETQLTNSGKKLDTIESDVVVSRKDRFATDMSTLAGADWAETDRSSDFLEWLQAEVPYTGQTRLQLLQDASKALNAPAVAKFFNDYKTEKAQGGNGDGEVITETPPVDKTDKLKKHIAPANASSGGQIPKRTVKPVLTRVQYSKFMKDTTAGKFSPAEWGGKTEAQVDAAFDAAIASHELQ